MFSLKMYTMLISMTTFLLFKNTYADPDITQCLDCLKEGFPDNMIDLNDSKQCAVYAMNNLIPASLNDLRDDMNKVSLSYYNELKKNLSPESGMKTVRVFCNGYQPAQQCIAKLRFIGLTVGMTTTQICTYVFQHKKMRDFNDIKVQGHIKAILGQSDDEDVHPAGGGPGYIGSSGDEAMLYTDGEDLEDDIRDQLMAADIRALLSAHDVVVSSNVLANFMNQNIIGNLALKSNTPTPRQHCIIETIRLESLPLGG